MPTLPTLEGQEAPISPSRQEASYPSHIANPGAVGAAISGMGREIEAQGIAADKAQDEDEYATARSAFLTHKAELEAHIQDDPNWKAAPDVYKSGLKDAAAAGAATLTNPKSRQKFIETADVETAQGLGPVLHMVNMRQRDQDRGDLDTLSQANLNTALSSPQNAPALIASTNRAFEAAAAKGTITPEDQVKRRREWGESYGKSWLAMQKPEDQVRILTAPTGGGVTPPDFDTQNAPGMTKPGNLDPWHRPVLHNDDGTYSTTRSFSIGTDDGEVLIPSVVDGKALSEDEAKAHFRDTGENLGTFKTPEAADAYAQSLHNAQASMYDAHGNPKGDIKAALRGQESGGNPNAPDSPTGAVGIGQLEPATFKRFAKPGENIRNPKDNAAVADRLVDYLSALPNVQGDAARIAVGYYSGEGNIAPLGSPAPYKSDKKPREGVKGPSTSEYVAQVMKRMGTPSTGAREFAPALATGTPADFVPVAERATILRQAEASVRADNAGQRTVFADQARDTIEFLHSGGDATKAKITPDQVRQMVPDEEGAQLADTLQHAYDYSSAAKQIATMPEGKLTEFIAGKIPQGPEGFRASAKEAGALVQAAKDRQTAIYGDGKTPGDPAAYVTTNFPDVAKAYAEGSKDPAKFGEYVKKVRGAQTALGIPAESQRILQAGDAQAIVRRLQSGDPGAAIQDLAAIEKKSGSNWPAVYADLGRAGLPATFQALSVVHPQDAQTMASALGKDAESKAKGTPMVETMRGVKYDTGDGKAPKSVTDLVEQQLAEDTGLQSLRHSYGVFGRAGAQSFDGVYDAVRATALYLFQTRGISPAAAAAQAAGMVTAPFEFVQQPGHAPLRLPRGGGDNFAGAAGYVLNGLQAKDLRPLPTEQDDQGHEIAGRPESERAAQALTHAQNAYWIAVPGVDGKGAARAIDPQSDTPVLRVNGKPLEIPFAAMPSLAAKKKPEQVADAFSGAATGFGR